MRILLLSKNVGTRTTWRKKGLLWERLDTNIWLVNCKCNTATCWAIEISGNCLQIHFVTSRVINMAKSSTLCTKFYVI